MEVTGRPTPDDIASMKSPHAATLIENVQVSQLKPLDALVDE
jgi:hypothetical protein